MAESSASSWGFVRLLIGLATGTVGVLIYTYDRVLFVPQSKYLLATSVLLLVFSIFASTLSAQILIVVDQAIETAAEKRKLNPDPSVTGFTSDQFEFTVASIIKFSKLLRLALWLFSLGLLGAVLFFLWNILSC